MSFINFLDGFLQESTGLSIKTYFTMILNYQRALQRVCGPISKIHFSFEGGNSNLIEVQMMNACEYSGLFPLDDINS